MIVICVTMRWLDDDDDNDDDDDDDDYDDDDDTVRRYDCETHGRLDDVMVGW